MKTSALLEVFTRNLRGHTGRWNPKGNIGTQHPRGHAGCKVLSGDTLLVTRTPGHSDQETKEEPENKGKTSKIYPPNKNQKSAPKLIVATNPDD